MTEDGKDESQSDAPDAMPPWPDDDAIAAGVGGGGAPERVEGERVDGEGTDGEAHPAGTLIVDVEGFEGPLDLLLTLAKSQKVDLAKISILELAEQYLAFIEIAKKEHLDLAADYLVMAAWLTFLKSKLLLPDPDPQDEPTGEELAARLQFQLQRLEAMREAAAKLMARDRLGRDVFARGDPEPVRIIRMKHYKDTLQDLLKAYTRQRTRSIEVTYEPKRPPIYAIEDARRRIETMLGKISDWSSLDLFVPREIDGLEQGPRLRRTALASTFTATLELVRDGLMDVRQLVQFGPLYVRRRMAGDAGGTGEADGGAVIPFPGGRDG